MTRITVTNPWYEKTYTVNETKKEVENRIYATNDYNDRFAVFDGTNELGEECTVTIKASNFASVMIVEEEER